MVELPFGAVSQDTHVPLAEGLCALRDVPGKLVSRLHAYIADAQVALDLHHGEPRLHVDAAAATRLRLQHHAQHLVLG
jgi:hypothetical protein